MGKAGRIGYSRSFRKRLVILFALLSIAGRVRGEELTEDIMPNKLASGEISTLRIELDYPYAGQIYVSAPSLPAGLEYESGPFIRPVRQERISVIEYTLTAREAGRYVIPPFNIRYPYGALRTEPLSLFVYDSGGTGTTAPPRVFWRIPERQIFSGQAFPVTIWADMLEKVPDQLDITLERENELMLRRLSELPRRERLETANRELYRIPLISFMAHAGDKDTLLLPAGSVGLGEITVSLPAAELPVQSVSEQPDEEILGTGAVQFTLETGREESAGIELIRLSLLYAGTANFPFIRFPSVEADGFLLLHTSERQEFVPELDFPYGYRGHKEQVRQYRLVAADEGTLTVSEGRVFNPVTRQFDALEGGTFTFESKGLPPETGGTAGEEPEAERRGKQITSPKEMGPLQIRQM